MEVRNAVIEATVESKDDELFVELEKLSDVELAQVGGGQGIIFL